MTGRKYFFIFIHSPLKTLRCGDAEGTIPALFSIIFNICFRKYSWYIITKREKRIAFYRVKYASYMFFISSHTILSYTESEIKNAEFRRREKL